MAINKISATTIQKLRDKSVEKLPTVVKNVTPTDLKKKFTGIVVDDKDSIVEEINRIVDETNELVLTLKNDEGYLYNGKFYQDAEHQVELSPETSKIYVDKITNNIFRWSGSQYIEISQSLALGETENTAYAGNKGKANRDDIDALLDGSKISKKAEQDEDGNSIKDTYATVVYVDSKANVISVNGKTGVVELDAEDVSALPADTPIPAKLSDLDNDEGFVKESDLEAALLNYVEKEVGKGLSTNDYTNADKNKVDSIDQVYTSAEKTKLAGIEAGAQVNTVTSVAGKTGAVVLDQDDIGDGSTYKRVSQAEKVAWNNKQDKLVAGNNITIDPITNVISASGGGGGVDWQDVENKPELYDKTEINAMLGNKVDKANIVDNLTTNDAAKVLSAKQGKVLQDTKEALANKAINFSVVNNTKYPTTKAVKDLVDATLGDIDSILDSILGV